MGFILKKTSFGPHEEYLLKNKKTLEQVRIVSGFGCNVRELILKKGFHLYSIIQGHDIPHKLEAKYSRGAQLVPFPNRIKDGRYTFAGKEYQLKINKPNENNAIHGLLYNRLFTLRRKILEDDSATLEFTYHISEDEFEGYPFAVLIKKTFTLDDDGLTVKTSAKNTGLKEVPYGDGWHPYFYLSASINKHQLKLPAQAYYMATSRGIPNRRQRVTKSSKYNFRKRRPIGSMVLDTCYALAPKKTNGIMLSYEDLEIMVWQDASYPFVQVYTPQNRTSLAIEPMTCPADAFNSGKGLIRLRPGDEFMGSYGVSLR